MTAIEKQLLAINGKLDILIESLIRKPTGVQDDGLVPSLGTEPAEEQGLRRNSKWATKVKWFKRANPDCLYCGEEPGILGLQVHHVIPFHECILAGRPDLEMDDRNLVCLCQNGVITLKPGEVGDAKSETGKPVKFIRTKNHHVTCGHLGDFKSYNPTVFKDVKAWYGLTEAEIKATKAYKAKAAEKPKSYSVMTTKEKTAFREMLDSLFPPVA